jgi:hypothetical protein
MAINIDITSEMNAYAYPIIFEALKDNVNNNLSIYLNNEMIRIFQKDEFIILKDSEGTIYYDCCDFSFWCEKEIDKITIICDMYGPLFQDVYNRKFWKAATIIQHNWKKHKNQK